MLKAIRIESYRGIHTGHVRDFGSINVFVGPNGSGKSTLLESIFFGCWNYSAHFNYQGFLQPRPVPLVSLRHNEDKFPSSDLLFMKNRSLDVLLEYEFDSQTWSMRLDKELNFGGTNVPQSAINYLNRMKFLETRVLLDRWLEQGAWDELLNVRGDRELKAIMKRVYDLNLESFTYSSHTNTLKALFSDRDYALNIDDLGVGMRIAFRMFIAILQSGGSAVLAEEFDAYQHVDNMQRFAKALLELANKCRTQLFLATHSLDMLRVFVDPAGLTLAEGDFRVFQTALSKDGEFEAVGLSAREAELLLEGGFDLRRAR